MTTELVKSTEQTKIEVAVTILRRCLDKDAGDSRSKKSLIVDAIRVLEAREVELAPNRDVLDTDIISDKCADCESSLDNPEKCINCM